MAMAGRLGRWLARRVRWAGSSSSSSGSSEQAAVPKLSKEYRWLRLLAWARARDGGARFDIRRGPRVRRLCPLSLPASALYTLCPALQALNRVFGAPAASRYLDGRRSSCEALGRQDPKGDFGPAALRAAPAAPVAPASSVSGWTSTDPASSARSLELDLQDCKIQQEPKASRRPRRS